MRNVKGFYINEKSGQYENIEYVVSNEEIKAKKDAESKRKFDVLKESYLKAAESIRLNQK